MEASLGLRNLGDTAHQIQFFTGFLPVFYGRLQAFKGISRDANVHSSFLPVFYFFRGGVENWKKTENSNL